MIKIENLTKSYPVKGGRHFVFRDLNLSFPPDVNIGIIGPNGGGKSTLLGLLGGIDYPDRGRIVSENSFSWPLGLKGGFINHMSGRDNCRVICNLYGLGTRKIKRILEEIKTLSGIGRYFEEPVKSYSSGMSGRLGFALSMSFDFDYFLIDEITSVGDAQFKKLAKDALAEKANRSRIIMVSHSMTDIKRFCDVAVLVKDQTITLFENMDEAIRAYLPKTRETVEDLEALIPEATEATVKLGPTTLPESVDKHLPELLALLQQIEKSLSNISPRKLHDPAGFHRSLGDVYRALENPVAARKHYKISGAEDPYHPETFLKLGQTALEMGDWHTAEQALTEAEQLDQNHPGTLRFKAHLKQQQGDLPTALSAAERALRVDPKDDQSWTRRAAILLLLERPEEALASQLKAHELNPDAPEQLRQLARILSVRGQIALAQETMERARKHSRDRSPISLSEPLTTLHQLLRQL